MSIFSNIMIKIFTISCWYYTVILTDCYFSKYFNGNLLKKSDIIEGKPQKFCKGE